ncbi:hypothetical protein L3C95_19895 [Chitinophaga filiformis]|uniref:hypothetical protein n=1 Tax=Chitinophaga filiformis TaxID=104663 RepID=UPI001F449281|nr:hypothetical protein [Chitinophaga filiformis]MCF6405176.1 hypothetical protein [Chitinophaga filiformis]
MKSVLKNAIMLGFAVSLSFSATAQSYIENDITSAQTANFWITGSGKLGNGLILTKNGTDAPLLGIQLLNTAETRGANIQLTGGTNPGLATWIHDGTSWVERMRITATGLIGINAQAPGKRLDIADTSSIIYRPTGTAALPYGGIVQINNNSPVDSSGSHFLMTAVNASGYRNAAYIGIMANKGATPAPDMVFGQRTSGFGWTEAMRIKGNGSVAIGTTEVADYKLAVKGAIGATRVKVTLTGWADFVFEPDYRLPSLTDLETYIKKNKHLPDVPSASEVAKEGLDLGEMNKILLQKIEELTLHVIEMQKEIDQLKKHGAPEAK